MMLPFQSLHDKDVDQLSKTVRQIICNYSSTIRRKFTIIVSNDLLSLKTKQATPQLHKTSLPLMKRHVDENHSRVAVQGYVFFNSLHFPSLTYCGE